MSLYPDQKYSGEVTRGKWMESQKGTLGFEIMLECEDGAISHTIWVTETTKERAEQDFIALGVTPAQLRDESYLRNEMPLAVVGAPISFGTKEEDYKGKKSIKVSWFGKPRAPRAATLEGSVAALFRGEAPPVAAEVADDDIPF
jgi:hypothetical protein